MRSFGFVLILSMILGAGGLQADEPATTLDISARIEAIDQQFADAQKAYLESIKNKKPEINLIRDGQKKREADYAALVKEIQSLGPGKTGYAEQAALADLYGRLREWEAAITHSQAAIAIKKDSPAVYADLILAFAEKGDLDNAEAALKQAIADSTDKDPLKPLHQRLYILHKRAEHPLLAAEHLSLYLPSLRAVKDSQSRRTYVRNVDDLGKLFIEGGEPAKALRRHEEEIAFWNDVKPADVPLAPMVARELLAQKVALLAKTGDKSGAEALFAKQKEEVEAALKAAPDDIGPILAMASLLHTEREIGAPEKQTELRDAWLGYLDSEVAKHPEEADLLSVFSSAYLTQIQSLANEDKLDEALALMKQFQATVANIPKDTPPRVSVTATESMLKKLIRRMVVERRQKELIGKPMPPLETDVWVNGSPLTAEDLKGKVILLDFWAVWCGPCRATFPHLTEWHEKYKDEGLVVIGLTRYYSYGWDDEKKVHVKEANLPPEKEVAAVEKFVAHHGLKHRLAYIPEESDLSDLYAVSGIPHVVIIDRSGVVRLIRVGSGEKNAHDIEVLLDELIKAKPEGTAAN